MRNRSQKFDQHSYNSLAVSDFVLTAQVKCQAG